MPCFVIHFGVDCRIFRNYNFEIEEPVRKSIRSIVEDFRLKQF